MAISSCSSTRTARSAARRSSPLGRRGWPCARAAGSRGGWSRRSAGGDRVPVRRAARPTQDRRLLRRARPPRRFYGRQAKLGHCHRRRGRSRGGPDDRPSPGPRGHRYLHAARGELLRRLGRNAGSLRRLSPRARAGPRRRRAAPAPAAPAQRGAIGAAGTTWRTSHAGHRRRGLSSPVPRLACPRRPSSGCAPHAWTHTMLDRRPRPAHSRPRRAGCTSRSRC
jgi:hypothetical protein